MSPTTRPITVDVPTPYYDLFTKMLNGMGFKYDNPLPKAEPKPIKKAKPKRGTKEYILDTIVEGVREAKLYEQGLIELPTLEEVLDEL